MARHPSEIINLADGRIHHNQIQPHWRHSEIVRKLAESETSMVTEKRTSYGAMLQEAIAMWLMNGTYPSSITVS